MDIGKDMFHQVRKEENQVEQSHKQVIHKPRKPILKSIEDFYDTNYKKLLIIPILLLLLSMVQIGYQYSTTGDFVNKGVDLKGGVIVRVLDPAIQDDSLKSELQNSFAKADISVRSLIQQGVKIGVEAKLDIDVAEKANMDLLKSIILKNTEILTKDELGDNIRTIQPELGDRFFNATFRALIIAFLFMGIVVFIYFGTFIPSLAVILAAFSDMIITLAILNIAGIKLSTAGIAAFLMLIGYSVDTDILLTTKVLKMKGPVINRIKRAMKTGLMMSLTTLVAISVAISFTLSFEIQQIMLILLIGLMVDLINTWIQNAGILRYYVENKKNG